MALKQEMSTVVKTRCRTTGIVVEYQIRILVRLGARAIAQEPKQRNLA